MSVDHPGCTPASDLPPPHQRIEWGLLPEETLDALIEFVSALVSACSLYGEMCMACAARHLMPPEEVSGQPEEAAAAARKQLSSEVSGDCTDSITCHRRCQLMADGHSAHSYLPIFLRAGRDRHPTGTSVCNDDAV